MSGFPSTAETSLTEFHGLLAMVNEKPVARPFRPLSSEDGLPIFRHAMLLRGTVRGDASVEQIEDLVNVALSESERFYPGLPIRHLGRQGRPSDAVTDGVASIPVGEA